MRAVVDANVLIATVLSSRGAPAELLRSARDGAFELIVSELVITELDRALAYPKLRKRISAEQAASFIGWLRDHGTVAEDPVDPPPVTSPDPDDDYLLALAVKERAYLVTGDHHLLGVSDELPIHQPAEFLRIVSQTR